MVKEPYRDRPRVLRVILRVGALLLALMVLGASTPPAVINYQGVLRDPSDAPLEGDHDMVFRFWSHETAGDEILIDTHDTAHANPVTVSGGLFNVDLGGGVVSDGSGPGAYVTLAHVFRDYGDVWLEISVGGETLDPRVRVVSAAYAINADHLDGITSQNFLRSNTSDQFTFGTLTVAGGTALQVDGDLQMNGSVSKATTDLVSNFNADLLDGLHSSAFAGASHTHPGSEITSAVSEASNADTLDGLDSGSFLNTSSVAQTKAGPLTVDSSAVPGEYGVRGYGPNGGGYFQDSDDSGTALVAVGGVGIQATGNTQGGYFQDLDGSGLAYVANNDTGIEGYGNAMGGYFQDLDNSGYAEVGSLDTGIRAYGNESGGYFKHRNGSSYASIGTDEDGIAAVGRVSGGSFSEIGGSGVAILANADVGIRSYGDASAGFFRCTNGTGYTNIAQGNYGIHALGSAAGGWFEDSDDGGYAYVGNGNVGVRASGAYAGGSFFDSDGSGSAHVGYGDYGIDAQGTEAGGYFHDADDSGHAYVGYYEYGIQAYGLYGGGFFQDSDDLSRAYISSGAYGIKAYGSYAGGYFEDFDGSGKAYLGNTDGGIYAYGNSTGGSFQDADNTGHADVGYGDLGISAYGSEAGGHFEDLNDSGFAYVGYGGFGIHAHGDEAGGYFEDTNGSSVVWVGRNDNGISSYGDVMGGYFEDSDNGTVARIAYGGYGINSNGTKNFVQNHPYDNDKVIVYSSLEGDEVGTYTRGTARLENGVATVPLGETFRWVTNPDVGLTVHLTPVGAWSDLYVIEKSTEQIVVGSRDGAPDAAFDYLVLGLRIGFEEAPPVREKDGEAFLPSMVAVRRMYEENPALRGFNALERFKKMVFAVQGPDDHEIDLGAAAALRAAIQEYDPAVHGPLTERRATNGRRPDPATASKDEPVSGIPTPEAEEAVEVSGGTSFLTEVEKPTGAVRSGSLDFPVTEPVERGDLLVLDPETPGRLRRAVSVADPGVVGIAADDPVEVEGERRVPLVESNYAFVKVDAGYGAVRPGDLLTSSPTPGHAMLAIDPIPGTVIGRAMEPVEYGTGMIRVLVTIR